MATKPAGAKPGGAKKPGGGAAKGGKTPAKVPVPAPAPVAAPGPAGSALKMKALVEQVAGQTGGKKKDVRETLEAAFRAMGTALSQGHDLHLPPLGKARVGKVKELPEGRLLVVRLRQIGAENLREKDVTEGVADPGE